MFKSLLQPWLSSSDISEHEEPTSIEPVYPMDTRVQMECREFLPDVYDTWTDLHTLSNETTRFRDIYDRYQYERSEDQKRDHFEQLKVLDDKIYRLSLTIHQRIQALEKLVQPIFDEHRRTTMNGQSFSTYTPASIRIAQNQLNSLKLSFKRQILKHNFTSLSFQNDLKRSVQYSKTFLDSYQQISRATLDKIKHVFSTEDAGAVVNSDTSQDQIQLRISEDQQPAELSEQELEIIDLEARLESVRILKDRVRQMNEMTMALYLSVQEQNDLTDNIWLNTSAGSDYINQSVDEFRLVKHLKQSETNLWIKLVCIAFCFLLILLLILTVLLLLNQR